jgi:hypothetical protein
MYTCTYHTYIHWKNYNWQKSEAQKLPYLHVYKPPFFWPKFALENWGEAFHGFFFGRGGGGARSSKKAVILQTTEPATPVLYVVKPPVETVSVWDCILQPIAHVQRHQRITSVSEYFDYMRVAHATDSQKSEDRDITDNLS